MATARDIGDASETERPPLETMLERLKREFSDTLDKAIAAAGIYVEYEKGFGEDQRVVIELGVPYRLARQPGQGPALLVGSYIRSEDSKSRLIDFYNRGVTIPVERIVDFRRIEFQDTKPLRK